MGKIRILQVLDKINQNSGVSSVVMNYYRHFMDDEIVFDFMVNEAVDAKIEAELEERGSRVYVLPGLTGKQMPRYIKEVKQFFKEHEGEYLIVHGHIPNAAIFYLAMAKYYGVPVRILHSHNARGADGFYKKIRNYLLNHIGVYWANQYFACSGSAADYLFGKKKHGKVTILPNAIDVDRYKFDEAKRKQMRKAYQVEERFVIGHVGRFAEQKNHIFMIEIAKKLKKRLNNFTMIFVGDGDLRPEINRKIKEEHLEDNMILVGSVQNVEDYLQMMDVFILPSIYEGLPVVGVEAQANGLPCVFSNQITREIELTQTTYFLPLKQAEWVIKLEELKKKKRKMSDAVEEKGYNIRKEAEHLGKIYRGMLECLEL